MHKLTIDAVRSAIQTLEQVSELYEYDPKLTEWSPADLRVELTHIESELHDQSVREELADRIHNAFEAAAIAGTDAYKEILQIFKEYEICRLHNA